MSPRQGLVRGTLTYLRRDLREIVAPTSLPDDDGRERADGGGGGGGGGIDGDSSRSSSSSSPSSSSSRRFAGRLRAVASGVSDYCDSWKKPVEAASISAHEKDEDADALREATGDARDALASASRQAASAAAAAAAATVTGSEALRPALRHLYRTRAAAYRDAVFSFVEGYREGISGAAVVEEDDDDEKDKEERGERGRSRARPPNKETTTTPPRNGEKK